MMDCIPVMRVSALLLLSLSVVAATASNGTADVVFTFKNRCSQNLWMGAQGMSNVRPSFQFNGLNFFAPNNGGWELPAGSQNSVSVPYDFSAGRFWARTGCSGTVGADFHCETGDCGPWVECSTGNIPRGGAPPASLAEFTLNANNQDYFDISFVDGFNLPMTIHVVTYDSSQQNPDQYWCNSPECLFNINDVCPPELAVYGSGGVVACFSACMKFNTDEYCCRDPCCGQPSTCTPDKWGVDYPHQVYEAHCPQAYSYAYDDNTSTFFCRNTNYDIIFC